MMIFDTHCHYNDESFDSDRDDLIKGLPGEGVDRICEIGYNLESSEKAVHLAEEYRGTGLSVYSAVGFHPQNANEFNPDSFQKLEELSYSESVVAIGEIGLDYYRLDKRSPIEKEQDEEKKKRGEEVFEDFDPEPAMQKECFISMIELAKKRNLPIVIHSRDAALDSFRIVRDHKAYINGGIVHCFSYPLEVAKDFVSLGMMIGIGGVLTFTNAKKLKQVAEEIPLEHIVLETDCPYMAPVPVRGTRNYSGNLRYVVDFLADLKGISAEEVIRVTEENGEKVYRIQ